MSGDLKRRGKGIKTIKKRFKKPGTVDVGVIDAGKHESGELTVAEIAFQNEFGTAVIPERSFMRTTVKEKKNDIIALQKKLLVKIREGKIDVEAALGLIGEFVSDKIKTKIVAIRSPPNSPVTIKAKGSSNPLIDTGQMKNSITYEVNR